MHLFLGTVSLHKKKNITCVYSILLTTQDCTAVSKDTPDLSAIYWLKVSCCGDWGACQDRLLLCPTASEVETTFASRAMASGLARGLLSVGALGVRRQGQAALQQRVPEHGQPDLAPR